MTISQTPGGGSDDAAIDLRDSTITLALLREAYEERLDLLTRSVRGTPAGGEELAASAGRIRDLEWTLNGSTDRTGERRLPRGGPDPSIFLG